MHKALYRFKRNNGIYGFMSKSTPSTDALNALQQWSESEKGRSYKVETDEDEILIAHLSWNEDDANAGPDLDSDCNLLGVERLFEGD